jgi:hypothetical protein
LILWHIANCSPNNSVTSQKTWVLSEDMLTHMKCMNDQWPVNHTSLLQFRTRLSGPEKFVFLWGNIWTLQVHTCHSIISIILCTGELTKQQAVQKFYLLLTQQEATIQMVHNSCKIHLNFTV